jgi:hypothetical protein
MRRNNAEHVSLTAQGIAYVTRIENILRRKRTPAEHPSPLTRRDTSIITTVWDLKFSQQCCWNSKTCPATPCCWISRSQSFQGPSSSHLLGSSNFRERLWLLTWRQHHDASKRRKIFAHFNTTHSVWNIHVLFFSKMATKYFVYKGGVPYNSL